MGKEEEEKKNKEKKKRREDKIKLGGVLDASFTFFQEREIMIKRTCHLEFSFLFVISHFVMVGIYPQVVFENHWIKYCSVA